MLACLPKAYKHIPSRALWCLAVLLLQFFPCWHLAATEPVANRQIPAALQTNAPFYNVQSYVIEGKTLLATNILVPLLSRYTGTNISVEEIVRAAADLQLEYSKQGFQTMNVIIAQKRITNGIVTMGVFPGAIAQIVVSGIRYAVSSNGVAMAANLTESNVSSSATQPQNTTNSTATNAGPHFTVDKYLIAGNSVLTPQAIAASLTNAAGTFGTNVTLNGIRTAAAELQGAYRARGYVTVAVGLPPQKLTNATVKMQVTEGRLASIEVKGNHYFSSNNVMRALPSLHTNIILNGLIFQAELNQANANQDRQIYPIIDPGPDPGTSDLTLKIKDRLPLHAKVELNNQSSPGTPDLRLNSSAVYNNLWQHENSFGVQYGFSPEVYKLGNQWNLYDRPLVANYSAFYRLPLGNPKAMQDVVANNPESFGYNEATRKFNLPPPSGLPELTFFASRSSIDTGLSFTPQEVLATTSVTNGQNIITTTNLSKNASQQDLTVNNDIGFRFNLPLTTSADFHSGVSGGFDFKTYELTSRGTNIFTLNVIETDYAGNQTLQVPVISYNYSPLPLTVNQMEYLPLSVRYDAGWHDFLGVGSIGLGLNANLWFSSLTSKGAGTTNAAYLRDAKSLQFITSSPLSSGNWIVLNPSFSHQFEPFTNWPTTFRADGQWASEPLISNEQFGAGGVNSVRGYREGEVFGDNGWHISFEQQTPPHVVGPAYGNTPIVIRGSVYMDYATVYLLDPQGRPDNVSLWGAGFGGVASIGSHWEARLLFSWPLLGTANTPANQPYFNFGLTAQF